MYNFGNYQNYYPQQTNPQQSSIRSMPQQLGLKGRPVSSLEEARATTIDFDGSIFFFPDLANRRIYTKQINMDGTASLNMYELKEIPTVNTTANVNTNFVTREEFEEAIKELQLSMAPKPAEEILEPSVEAPKTSTSAYKF